MLGLNGLLRSPGWRKSLSEAGRRSVSESRAPDTERRYPAGPAVGGVDIDCPYLDEGDTDPQTGSLTRCARCPAAPECAAFAAGTVWPVWGLPWRRAPSLGTDTLLRAFCTALENRSCWRCQAPVGIADFCPACRALQPPAGTRNFFDIMGCDRSFVVDIPKLQLQYRTLQRSLHPDNFSQKSQKERDFAEIQSALVNKAYRTLLKPLNRGLYMLKLEGIELKEKDSDLDTDYLREVLEINEKLAEADAENEIYNIGHFVEAKIEELIEDITKAFEKGDLKDAKLLLTKMKYFSNLESKVKERLSPC